MEEKITYAVVSEEYCFNFQNFQTIKRYNVLTVTTNEEKANEIMQMYDMVLSQTRDAQEIDANGNMLTSYSINSLKFDGTLTIDEVKERIKYNQDFTWGQNHNRKI